MEKNKTSGLGKSIGRVFLSGATLLAIALGTSGCSSFFGESYTDPQKQVQVSRRVRQGLAIQIQVFTDPDNPYFQDQKRFGDKVGSYSIYPPYPSWRSKYGRDEKPHH